MFFVQYYSSLSINLWVNVKYLLEMPENLAEILVTTAVLFHRALLENLVECLKNI